MRYSFLGQSQRLDDNEMLVSPLLLLLLSMVGVGAPVYIGSLRELDS